MLKLMCPLPFAIITRDMRADDRYNQMAEKDPTKFIVFLDKKKRTLLKL